MSEEKQKLNSGSKMADMTCDETKILDFNLANTTVKDEENLQSCSPVMDKTINELT